MTSSPASCSNLLAATARLVADAVDERLEAALDHTASAPAALITIGHHPGLSIESLRNALGITHSGTVRLIDRLEADELVRRQKQGERAVRLQLTRRGRRAVERLERARLAAVTDLVATLLPEQQRQLEDILARLLSIRTHSEEDLRRICRLCSFEACESRGMNCPVADAARQHLPSPARL